MVASFAGDAAVEGERREMLGGRGGKVKRVHGRRGVSPCLEEWPIYGRVPGSLLPYFG